MMLAVFQTVGAALAFISTAIIVRDRLMRHRPYVRLISDTMVEGGNRFLYAEIVNKSEYYIIVRLLRRPNQLAAKHDDSTLAVIEVATGTESSVAIAPGEMRRFQLQEFPGYRNLRPETRIRLSCRWWPVQSMLPWHPGWPMTAISTKGRLDTMISRTRHMRDGDEQP